MIVDIQIDRLDNEFVIQQMDIIEEALSALRGQQLTKFYRIELSTYDSDKGENMYIIFDKYDTPLLKLVFCNNPKMRNAFDIEVYYYQNYLHIFKRLKVVTYVEELIDIFSNQ